MNTKRYTILALLLMAMIPTVVAKDRKAVNDTVPIVGNLIKVENEKMTLSRNLAVVSFDLVLDSLRLRSGQRVALTPMVRGADSNVVFMNQILINSRRQDIEYERKGYKKYNENIIEVRRMNKEEQTIHYDAVVEAEEWMQSSDVVIAEDQCGCGNVLASNTVPIMGLRDPVVAFERPQASPKIYEVKGQAYIDFPVDKIDLYPEYHRNPTELEKIVSTIDNVRDDKNVTITHIDICGFASPESPYAHNEYLAENRARTIKDYVRNMVNLPDETFSLSFVPENWDGLKEYVESSELKHKEEILSLIDSDMDPDVKENRIKGNYPSDYAYMLREYYPYLRRSDYTITYSVRSFTVDEAREIFHTNPGHLSMEEMYLVAQTLEPESDEFHEIFETAIRLFPDDPTANLNMACMEIERGDYDRAEKYLDKAGETPYVWNARGVIACRRGDTIEATEFFQKASDAGLDTAAENLLNLSIRY